MVTIPKSHTRLLTVQLKALLWTEWSTQVSRRSCDLDFTCLSVTKTTLISFNTTMQAHMKLVARRRNTKPSASFSKTSYRAWTLTATALLAWMRKPPSGSLPLLLICVPPLGRHYSILSATPAPNMESMLLFFVQVTYKTARTMTASSGVGDCSAVNSQALYLGLEPDTHAKVQCYLLSLTYSGL